MALLTYPYISPLQLDHILRDAVTQKCSVKKVLLQILQNSHENTCARVSFSKKASDLQLCFKRDSGTGVFLRICEAFKNSFFHKTPPVDAFVSSESYKTNKGSFVYFPRYVKTMFERVKLN